MAVQFNPFTGNLDIVGAGASANPGGSDTQVQFNDGGAFGGSADLTWDDTGKLLTVGGDIDLDDGGTYATTLQVITPTANRTISFPNATGTLALVAGSSGQLIYNNAGANAGTPTLTYDGSILTSSGRFINSYNATASSPAKAFTGTWFTGGTATTTKPQVLIEPSGTTSTAWSTSGTGLGVNAASGFAGRLIDLQVNGTSYFQIVPGSNSSTLRLFGSSGWENFIRSKSTAGSGFNIESNLGLVGRLEFGVAGGSTGAGDTFIYRDGAANTLAQRDGTNAQTYRLYNTYTDASNYERVAFKWDTNTFKIEPEAAGTGTLRSLAFSANGAASTPPISLTGTWFSGGTSTTTKPALLIEPTGTTSTAWSTSGTGLGVNAPSGFAGNLLDLQVNGTSQLRVNQQGDITSGGGNTFIPDSRGYRWSTRGGITAPSDGIIQLTNGAGTGFSILRLGGGTTGFPAVKRNNAELQVRLADDSAYTTLDAQLRAQGTAPASASATGTAGDIRYDADYVYICTATDTWKRAALSTWP